jgi:hypothetical protein
LDGQSQPQYNGQQQWTWKKAAAGGHFITLEVTDSKGGSDSISRKIKIPEDENKPHWKIGPFSCFIATAAYGSETAKELDTLRSFRDKVLMQSWTGRLLVDTYYRTSPPLAEFISENEWLRIIVREGLLDPIVNVLKQTQPAWDN